LSTVISLSTIVLAIASRFTDSIIFLIWPTSIDHADDVHRHAD